MRGGENLRKRSVCPRFPRFAYAEDNPANRIDPTGLVDWSLVLSGFGNSVSGIVGMASAAAMDAGTGGLAVGFTVFLGLTSATAFVKGTVQMTAGFADDPSLDKQKLGDALTLESGIPTSFIAALLTHGNSAAIRTASKVNDGASALVGAFTAESQLDRWATIVGTINSVFNEPAESEPVFHNPVPIEIDVSDTFEPVDPVPSEMPTVLNDDDFLGGGMVGGAPWDHDDDE